MTQSIHENRRVDSNTQHLNSAITGHSNNLATNKTNPVPYSVEARVKAGQAYQAKERQGESQGLNCCQREPRTDLFVSMTAGCDRRGQSMPVHVDHMGMCLRNLWLPL